MNRKKIYYATLIFPLIVLATIPAIELITLGNSFVRNLIATISKDWYHIAGGLSAIIIGIEYFGKNLEKQLKSKRRLWIAFKYTLKIFGFFLISNIITITIEKAKYLDGIGDFIYKTTIAEDKLKAIKMKKKSTK